MPHRLLLDRLLLALGLALALSACQADEAMQNAFSGVGESHPYTEMEVPLAVPVSGSVAVGAVDLRPYVVEGDERARFVGTGPGRYHNTVKVATTSERPLADLVAEAVARALARQGAEARAVPLDTGSNETEALAGLAAGGADRVVLVRLYEWRTDSQIRVAAQWNLEATVYDRAGRTLGRRTRQGAETVGTSGLRQDGGSLAVEALARQLGYMLGDPAIAGALSGPPPAPA